MKILIVLSLFVASSFAQECGKQPRNISVLFHRFSNKIEGGCLAQQGEVPWEGYIEIHNSTGSITRACGVTVLSKNYVLTAARCVEFAINQTATNTWNNNTLIPNSHFLKFGTLNKYDTSVPNNTIAQATYHPDYNNSDFILHNIAIIKLTNPLTFNDDIQPICLPSNDHILTRPNKPNNIAGWGGFSLDSLICGNKNTQYSNFSSQYLVKGVGVPVIGYELCLRYYPESNITLNNATLCAGSDFTGASNRQGDWGTPLYVADDNGIYFQTGILSVVWHYTGNQDQMVAPSRGFTKEDKYLGLYTRVSSYCDWIKSTTNGEAQCIDVVVPTQAPPATCPSSANAIFTASLIFLVVLITLLGQHLKL